MEMFAVGFVAGAIVAGAVVYFVVQWALAGPAEELRAAPPPETRKPVREKVWQ